MSKAGLPVNARITEALARFGVGLRHFRLRRRLPMRYVADGAAISRSTLHRMERGDPAVGFGLYAAVLDGYALLGRLEEVVDPRADRAGLAMEASRLPRRVRRSDL